MITKNFKQLSRMLLIGDGPSTETGNILVGMIKAVDISGAAWYLTSYSAEGIGDYTGYTSDGGAQGVTFGSGTTQPTENDYKLESPISSGISVTRDVYKTVTSSDKLSVEIHYSVTNTTGSDITISEIGLKKSIYAASVPNISATPILTNTPTLGRVFLIDRTLLDNPVTIHPGDTADLKYILSVDNPNKSKVVNGIKCVPFETGSDQEIVDMIDAAHSGIIDLETDGGWGIGDRRCIDVESFTDGITTTDRQKTFIEITSFKDYNNSGCVMQFDVFEPLEKSFQMHTNTTDVVGYAGCNMRLVTLPALAEALPSWLKSRLLTFSVLSRSVVSGLIESVPSNKLALRSLSELSTSQNAVEGEGDVIDGYSDVNNAWRYSRMRRYANGSTPWYSGYNSGYDVPMSRTFYNKVAYRHDGVSVSQAENILIAPFGCL